MGRDSYSQSVASSTRTFKTAPATAEDTPAPKPARHLSFKLKNALWIIAAVLVLLSCFLFLQYRQAQARLASPEAASANAKQVKDTLAKVASLAVVPKDETPTVVTVADAGKLKGQSFFARAKTGDKVIVYVQAKQAILYRPSTNQIVNMAATVNNPSE